MGNNTTPDRMRGLLIPTANITQKNVWTAQSSFTEMNPRAGVAKASQPFTGLVLEMAGEQSENIQVETVQGGIPGDSVSAFKWRGVDTINLSQNSNNILTDWKYLSFDTSPTRGTTSNFNNFDVVGTNDGSIYWVSEFISVLTYTIKVRRQKRDGPVETLYTFVNTTLAGAPDSTAKPMITQLKDGSLLVAYFDYTGTDQVNLVVWRSHDEGQNWKKVSSRALAVPISVGPSHLDIEKTNLVVVDDYVSLTMSTFSNLSNNFGNAHRQYVSRDQGATFNLVGSNGETYHMLSATALPQGRLGFAYISDRNDIKFTRIANPGVNLGRTDFQSKKEVSVYSGSKVFCTKTTNQLSGGAITIWYQDSVIYIAVMDTDNVMYGFQSTDQGDTWSFISESDTTPTISGGIMYDPSSTEPLTNLKSTVWEGRAVVTCLTEHSVGCLFFGGWSSVDFEARAVQPARNQYLGYQNNWVNNILPGSTTGYTAVGSGSDILFQNGVTITTTSNTRYYQYQGLLPATRRRFYKFKMKVSAGASSFDDYIFFHVTSNNPSTLQVFTLKIRLTENNFVVLDHSTVHTTVSVDLTNFHEFLVFQDETDVKIYYRRWDEKQAKKWTEVSVTLGTQGAGPSLVTEWGHKVIPPSSGTYSSQWSEFHVGINQTGKPGDIVRGGPYPTYGEYIYINEGLLLTAKESPARAEDVYQIDARADFPVDNIFHQVALSPRVMWRSKDATAIQEIAWFMDPVVGSTASQLGLSDVFGLHLSGINWKTATLKSWNGASWDVLTNIDTSTGLQGTFKREGATLVPASSSTPFQVHYDECRGWYAELSFGETTKIVKIKQNSEGMWTTSTAKAATLLIDTDHTDPATLPASGNIALMPTSITLLAELFQDLPGAGVIALQVSIPVQETLEGYFQIGTLVAGDMYFMAPQYQRGRSITHSPNIETVETLDGMFYSRKLSEGRKTFQVAWTEPVDTRDIMALDPDYWQFTTTAGAQPIANYGDSPFSMLGLCRYLANQTPVVYLPAIKKSTGSDDTQLFNRYHEHSLVRTEGEVTMESVLGEESVDEMFRVATVNFTEVE